MDIVDPSPTKLATIAAADLVLNAPAEHIEAEPPECLLEILEQLTDDLGMIRGVGIGWRIIQLEMMKTRIQPKQGALL